MRTHLITTTICLGAVIYGVDARCETKKPNVVFIFLDDLTYDGINALGDRDIKTPNIDALIATGTTFSNTYMMGGWNGALSIASRSQLLTGRFMWNSRTQEKLKYREDIKSQNTWSQTMNGAGYKTFMTGKWHVAHVAPESIFDVVDTPRKGGMPNTVEESYNRPIEGQQDNWSPYDSSIGGFWEGGKHWSEVQADVSIEFINENKDAKQPIFMYCAFNAPHDPRQAPKEYVDMYPLDEIEVPENFQPKHPLWSAMMAEPGTLRDERLAPMPRTEYAVKRHLQEYYAIISHADTQIGRIVDAIRDNGLAENTIIVFAADNGLALGQHGYIGKQSLYDHSIRVPLVFNGIGVPKGERRSQMVYLHDLVPTIYDLVGVETPKQVEYQSQYNALVDGRAEARESIYAAYVNKQRMIRDDRYKLIFIPEAKYVYLFDMQKDPAEMVNLYGKSKYNKIVKKLAKEYIIWAEKSGDTMDITSIYPQIF